MCKLSPDLFNPSLKPGPKRTRNVPNEARKGALTSPLLSDAPRRSDCLLLAEERRLRLSAVCRGEAASPRGRPPGCAPGAQRVPAGARARRVTGRFSGYSHVISMASHFCPKLLYVLNSSGTLTHIYLVIKTNSKKQQYIIGAVNN